MNAVGRIGSYLYRGVGTVSGPFHPFGGAIDVIVVEQPDGTFKSSPWYVRFGKFQGVLKNRTNLIKIEVNGVDAGFNMYLAHTGQAYFLREVDDVIEEEGEVYPLSSGDEAGNGIDKIKIPLKSKSCNYDAGSPRSANGKSGILGFVFGGKSVKESPLKVEDKDDDGSSVGRVSSMERAQIAADLLDVNWSTNIDTRRSFEAKVEDLRQMNSENNLELELDGSSSVLDETRRDYCVNPLEMLLDSDKIMETPLVASPTQRFIDEKEQDFRESTSVEDFGEIYGEESGVQSLLSREASGTPCLVENGSCEASSTVLPITSEGSGRVDLCVESMNVSARTSPVAQESVSGCDMDFKENLLSDPEVVNHVILGSADQADLGSICSSQAGSSFGSPVQVDNNDIHLSVENSEKCQSTSKASKSEIPEEEQFSFSDLDDSKPGGSSSGGSTFVDTVKVDGKEIYDEKENASENSKTISQPINIERKKEEIERMVESLPIMHKDNSLDVSSCQPLSQSLDSKTLKASSVCFDAETENSPSLKAFKHVIANPEVVELSLCKHLLNEGMGAEAASQAFNSEKLDMEKFASLGPSILENDKLIVKIGGCYFPWVAAAPIILGMVSFGTAQVFEPKGMIAVDRNEKPGDVAPGSGGWKLWPFRRSRNDSEASCKDAAEVEEKPKTPKPVKKTVRALTPTSEELASLDLKEGMNSVNFVFSTNIVGTQQVDARIYLWKWNARIVISDVDGTITRSDVLGQFMPLVGIDWSQTGVTHLFSAVKENGYQLIFLSARAISQASVTRQFLVNLKQDGKALPDGPVVISPDGLFPSLFREVIRRAPHEFKIACLEEIRALFPPEHNPFYAGFGNRDTDEISYLKVGIPLGKIFIINPKGEVAVNRRVDTRSYTNLHALVNGMFPATSSEREDFNTWNFWKLPCPSVM